MVYNPLEESITRVLSVPVYYTGLHDVISLETDTGTIDRITVDQDYKIKLEVTIPAKGYRYFVLRPSNTSSGR